MQKENEPTRAALTVADALAFVGPDVKKPLWPPDVFAVAAYLLLRSNGYAEAVHRWPPQGQLPVAGTGQPQIGSNEWVRQMARIGEEWKLSATTGQPAPQLVQDWWSELMSAGSTPVSAICDPSNRRLCDALLQLCAAADEASAGVGDPTPQDPNDEYWTATADLLSGGTLCERIDPSRVRVLPKLHTPQTGVTLRSLSHNLALCVSSDIEPKWYLTTFLKQEQRRLNLLLVPWPKKVLPSQFREQRPGPIENMPPNFGFFTIDPLPDAPAPAAIADHVRALHQQAFATVGRIDGIVFPELALSQAEYASVQAAADALECMLIAGVSVQPRPDPAGGPAEFGQNYVAMRVPTGKGAVPPAEITPQHKHHRWRLDRAQILQYGIASSLDPSTFWWEYIAVRGRCLSFVGLNSWLTLCVLICEDLAREDPVGELVRAVGPNLVIALLMDGPQLKTRWASRSAMVLADDPGSSVLTLTNWGFTQICRPPHRQDCSRAVALWNDARHRGPIEIQLDPDADALVLTLGIDREVEWTADGRTDHGVTGYPFLAGIQQVRAQ